jgi:large subunit ribosomal protein L15e
MVASLYTFISKTWRDESFKRSVMAQRLVQWRKDTTIKRISRPTRIDRARSLGYKAKQGFVIVRVKVRKGGLNRLRPVSGRRPKRMGVEGYSASKSDRWIAEERAARKYPNLEVIGSYYVAEDGQYKYFEVILADPSHPAIKSDQELKWLQEESNRKRVFRGLTSPGKKARGLRKSRGVRGTHGYKWKKKEKERNLRRRHEASRYNRLLNYKIPGK